MKILELTNYSAGICGVWQRVKQEAELLSKNHEVRIFTSNLTKGCEEIASPQDQIRKIKIQRFPAKQLGGESFMNWNFERALLEFRPDIIIAHSFRHPHTTKAIKLAKKINAKIFLVSHAPFVEGNTTRSFCQKLMVGFYDTFIAPSTLKKFHKIITIVKWEAPFLKSLGAKKEQIVYIPNGIPHEFFKTKPSRPENKILFLGRISPVKNIETLINVIPLLKDSKIKIEIVGPGEKQYLNHLKNLVEQKNLGKRIIFSKPIYDNKEKIKKIDSCKIFVLPSKREAMPQSLIEAMARKKITIAANNKGASDIIQDSENGYLFEIGDPVELAEKINLSLSKPQNKLKQQARKDVEQFSWDKLIRELEELFK